MLFVFFSGMFGCESDKQPHTLYVVKQRTLGKGVLQVKPILKIVYHYDNTILIKPMLCFALQKHYR